jgi:hypothetical protein
MKEDLTDDKKTYLSFKIRKNNEEDAKAFTEVSTQLKEKNGISINKSKETKNIRKPQYFLINYQELFISCRYALG